MKLSQRIFSPLPRFFKKLRNVGMALATIGAVIIAAPVALPVAVVTMGGYIATAGAVITAVSQVTTNGDENKAISKTVKEEN